jgi:hypothetical protein
MRLRDAGSSAVGGVSLSDAISASQLRLMGCLLALSVVGSAIGEAC